MTDTSERCNCKKREKEREQQTEIERVKPSALSICENNVYNFPFTKLYQSQHSRLGEFKLVVTNRERMCRLKFKQREREILWILSRDFESLARAQTNVHVHFRERERERERERDRVRAENKKEKSFFPTSERLRERALPRCRDLALSLDDKVADFFLKAISNWSNQSMKIETVSYRKASLGLLLLLLLRPSVCSTSASPLAFSSRTLLTTHLPKSKILLSSLYVWFGDTFYVYVYFQSQTLSIFKLDYFGGWHFSTAERSHLATHFFASVNLNISNLVATLLIERSHLVTLFLFHLLQKSISEHSN